MRSVFLNKIIRLLVMSVLIGGLSLSLMSCGRSPLLHHDDEQTPAQNAARVQAQNATMASDCFLRFAATGVTGVGGDDICASVRWISGPIINENAFDLKFSQPIDVSLLSVDPTMPEHGGHGTAPVELVGESATLVHVRDIWLTMGGTWLFTIRLGTSSATFEVKL